MLEDHAALASETLHAAEPDAVLLPPMKELYAAMTTPLPKREREVVELRIAGALSVILLFALSTFAVAEVPTLPMSAIQWDVLYADDGDISEMFTPEYISYGDLGDESLPLSLLCGFAALTAAGVVVVHKRRSSAR